NLVRACQEGLRDLETKRLGRFQVDPELEFGRFLHWQVARGCALKDAIYIRCRSPKHIIEVDAVADEATFLNKGCYVAVHRRHLVARRGVDDRLAMNDIEDVIHDDEPAAPSATEFGNSQVDFRIALNGSARRFHAKPKIGRAS